MPRLERFFETLIGFHEGSLDLTGRHQRRYEAHLKRFMSFVTDFYLAMQHASRVVVEQDLGRTVVKMTMYEFSAPAIIEEFRTKWNLSRSIGEDYYARQISKVMKAMKRLPPKFQKLCLLDLPPELHHYIMNLARIEEARSLGATCRTLREISISYIYERHDIILKFDILRNCGDSGELNGMSEEEGTTSLRAQAQEARAKFLSEIDFMLAHGDILRRMRTLTVKDDWLSVFKQRIDIHSASASYADYWQPIITGVEDLLQRVHLATFISGTFGLTSGMLTALAQMNTLHSLQLSDCPFQPILDELAILPRISSVMNLLLVFHREAGEHQLELLSLLPNVRCLVIKAFKNNPLCIPDTPEGFFQRCNPFRSLEHLEISELSREDIHRLASWMRASALSGGGLHLTHFKLDMSVGLDRDELMNLIDVLGMAPLRILIFEGISYAGLDLFDRLADMFPRLEALTLIRRENMLQTETKPCAWPHATWEYAPHLARFQCLKYFAWNFCIEPVFETTAWDLPLMESGFPEAEACDMLEWTREWDEHSSYEWKELARLFLSHCGTLEHIVFLHRIVSVLALDVERGMDGKVKVTSHQWDTPRRFEKYNPDGLGGIRAWFFPEPATS
ncbi:hypothetical protein OBBRIDRAFT_788220 [Obba rivulosa]|uniref:F-box domain-containing protein n=1 Tax=Obba rivulosa TaxID=1052685 RepID=A0A8E2DTD5_9APHY|nr:hypothetical protein OBBRIDRAFT_788220 [Obba rivulosa]